MVQYVFTPWRDRHELLLVRRQLYHEKVSIFNPSTTIGPLSGRAQNDSYTQPDRENRRKHQHQAVARVSMWMQRGNCPHMVESTALLMAAMLNDEDAVASENAASSTYAVRAAYSAAFSRFVTGLLDGHQDKQRKQSMYSIAKTIGLPATFVELRHQSTHEQLPSLAKLRSAARKALDWIWDYYWKHLGEESEDPCKDAVLAYLREEDETKARGLVNELEQWPRERVLKTIEDLKTSLPGNKVYLKCARLSQELVEAAAKPEEDVMVTDTDELGTGDSQQAKPEEEIEDSDDDFGWSRFKGTWRPKPIGIV